MSDFSLHFFQILIVSGVVGVLAYAAFLSGQAPNRSWAERMYTLTWWKGLQFWVWPCLTFAMTYYLVAAGIVMFLLQASLLQPVAQILMIESMIVLMAAYFYYLGTRVLIEVEARGEISEGMRRCPFVMDILTKTGWASPSEAVTSSSLSASRSK